MEKHLGSPSVEVTLPERPKFTAPLVLVHGLWAGRWSWQAYAAYLAHRGWECWALDLRGRPPSGAGSRVGGFSLQDYAEDVVRVGQELGRAPVLVGHGLGVLVVLRAALDLPVQALVALAPVVPRGWTEKWIPPYLFVRLRTLPALLGRRPLPPPPWTLASRFLLAGLAPSLQKRIWSCLVPDSGALVYSCVRGRLPFWTLPASLPCLVVAGTEDPLTPPVVAQRLAQRLQGDYLERPGQGHWLLEGEGWEGTVDAVHRWLVKRLGESLLLPSEAMED